ncbi:hypothetical protein DA718_04695 [Klebsiella huaxiensis]|nr:hypothetical protein DA718_04695 [Klebsiella huaxiensis]
MALRCRLIMIASIIHVAYLIGRKRFGNVNAVKKCRNRGVFCPLPVGRGQKHYSFSPLLAITSLYQLKLFLRERDISPVPSSCLLT